MSVNPFCIAGPLILIFGIAVLSMAKRRRTLFVFIPANVDPLDEGLDGWRGLAGGVRSQIFKKLMITWAILSAVILMIAAAWNPAKIVYAALQPTFTPTITPTATMTPTVTPTPLATLDPYISPTPQVIYVIITPIGSATQTGVTP